MKPLRWGLVGASQAAEQLLLPALRASENSDPVAVFSSSPRRGATFAADHAMPVVHRSLADLLDDDHIDAVYVSTHNELHAAQTIAAAGAGKHVLCEKPLALTLDDAIAMRSACDAAGVVLATNFHLRAALTHRKIRDLVAAGDIGEPLAARAFLARLLPPESRTWRVRTSDAGGGVVLDNTVHTADLLRFVLGDEVTDVIAFSAPPRLNPRAGGDHTMGTMRFASGLLASFHDAFTIPHAGTGLEVHGIDGSLIARETLGPTPTGSLALRRGDVIEPIALTHPKSLYLEGIRAFEAAVRGEGAPLASADDGIAALAVALAVLESEREGRSIAVDWKEPPVDA